MLSDHQKIKIQVPYILNVSVPIHNNHWLVSCWIGGAALSWQLVSLHRFDNRQTEKLMKNT